MCGWLEAMAGAGLAISAASAAANHKGKMDDAESMRGYQAAERYNAELARNTTYDQLQKRQTQEIEAATQALLDNSVRAVQARAKAEVSAAEGGVHGNSVESVARNLYMEQGRIDTSTVRNNEMAVQQLQDEKRQADASFRSRTNFPAVRSPSPLGLGLEIAGAGVSSYFNYERAKGRPTRGGGTRRE